MLDLYINIKQRRKELGMSQEELAELVGYKGRSMVSRVEHGDVDLPTTQIKKFAEALNTTPSALMGWNVEKEPLKELNIQLFASDDAFLDAKISNDKELKDAIKIYYSLPDEKRAEIRRYIKFVSQS